MQEMKSKRGGKGIGCLNEEKKTFKAVLRTSFALSPSLRVRKMQKAKRKRRGKGTGQSNEEKKAFKAVIRLSPGFGKLSKLGGSSSSDLSKQVALRVSESVVSIASFLGETLMYECAGMFIEGSCADATSILTVASLFATPDLAIIDDLTVKVRLPNEQVVTGWLHISDSKYDLAVVNIRHTCGFQTVDLCSSHHVESSHKVVAVGRSFNSGLLESTNGILISSPTNGYSELKFPTCKIDKAWVGGPLVDFEGNFVGMNWGYEEKTEFLPKNKILERLEIMRLKVRKMQKTKCKLRAKGTGRSNGENFFFKAVHGLSPGFGNLAKLGGSSSSELSKQVASGVSASVVSIASFLGDTLMYECTGMFIEGSCADCTSILTVASLVATPDHAITDDVTVKVRLPNEQVVIGWFHLSDLKYDLAVVKIRHTSGFQMVDLRSSHCVESNHKVVAVGRSFNSGLLKSTNGILFSSPTHGYSELKFSTCKIDEAWIGGPLVDFEGNFVGMNCGCKEKTKFLPKNKIFERLEIMRNNAADTLGYGPYTSGPPVFKRNSPTHTFEDLQWLSQYN